jgi:hypothetical protein
MGKFIDLTGKKFGSLTVVRRDESKLSDHAKWICICECGVEKSVCGISLRRGSTNSCGCYSLIKKTTHGLSGSNEYKVWHCMIERCTNKEWDSYNDYGGRGISVCERWMNISNFIADMGGDVRPKIIQLTVLM